MELDDVRRAAKLQGIDPGMLTKTELIRKIQTVEGNFSCFATARDGVCDQASCCWRNDCFAASKYRALP